MLCIFFFFNDTATTEIYTLSLHDALPISRDEGGHGHGAREDRGDGARRAVVQGSGAAARRCRRQVSGHRGDRKSTRLNSSHGYISYAVFCLKKKKYNNQILVPSYHTHCGT